MEWCDSPSVANTEKEQSAIEHLLSCSEDAALEEFDRVVISSSWDGIASGWNKTRPNVKYISWPDRKKRAKEKSSRVSPNFVDPESQYVKVKRLAGLITSSNSHNQQDAKTTWPEKTGSKFNLNKLKNVDVLSYEMPCWRYIIDPRTFGYVERPSLQLIRGISSQKNPPQTFVLDNGGMVTFQEVNGSLVFNDPSLAFDRHLLETFEHREEFRLRACDFSNFVVNLSPVISQYRTEDNKIKVVHSVCARSDLNNGANVCDMCRHRTQEVAKSELVTRFISMSDSALDLLKPLQKITPTQRRTAEESMIASKALVAQARNSKELKSDSSSNHKGVKKSKDGKLKKKRTDRSRLDWLPITRNSAGYSFIHEGTQAHGKFPDRPPVGFTKTFTLPHKNRKGKKLTLSEAANLVPKGALGDALNSLSKELDKKVEKGVSLSDPLLPSVSGTKLEVPS